VRVITRGLRAVIEMRALLNPFVYGFYAVQLFSHKVLRRRVVFPMLVLAIVGPALWNDGSLYRVAALFLWAICGAGALASVLSGTRLGRLKVLAIPFFFCMVYAASMLAAFNIVRGRRINLWEPQRAEPKTPAVTDAFAVTAAEEAVT
jgi:hypothetical protein